MKDYYIIENPTHLACLISKELLKNKADIPSDNSVCIFGEALYKRWGLERNDSIKNNSRNDWGFVHLFMEDNNLEDYRIRIVNKCEVEDKKMYVKSCKYLLAAEKAIQGIKPGLGKLVYRIL